MRKKIVAGNWKMNLASVIPKPNENVDIILFVPFTHIKINNNLKISLGSQNFYPASNGAFTGEISASMIKDAGAKHVLIGHSERRVLFSETDEFINKKVKFALKEDLLPMLCIGETLEDRDENRTMEVIKNQIKIALYEVADISNITLAYEPVWAIGTGKTATKEQAEEVCKEIREYIKELYTIEASEKIRILYGGSVNSKNAKEIFSMPNIDGALVGGASLTTEFSEIIEGAV